MTPMIRAVGVTKVYGATRPLIDLNLVVARGECVGVAAANGAGRSTLMRILGTLVPPTSGAVHIDGIDCRRDVYRVRRRIAYLGDEGIAGSGLTSLEYLEFIQTCRHASQSSETHSAPKTLVRAGVPDRALIDVLSIGVRQRLALAAALSTGADVLILDDPFRGMDPEGRSLFLRWVNEVRDSGCTIVVTSNEDRDLSMLCHRIVRLENGRLIESSGAATRPAVSFV